MAAQTPQKLTSIGSPLQRLVVYALYGVTTNDTVQTNTEFQKVYNWTWLPATGTSTVSNWSATVATNTNITLSPASITVDDGYLIVFGAGLQQQ
jgi:hypothetical protein